MNVLHTGRNEHDARRVQRPCRPFCFPQPFENLCLHSPVTGDTQSKLGSLKWLSNERSRIAIVNGACNIMGSCRTDGRRYISEKCKYSQKKAIIEFQNRFVPARLLPKAVSYVASGLSLWTEQGDLIPVVIRVAQWRRNRHWWNLRRYYCRLVPERRACRHDVPAGVRDPPTLQNSLNSCSMSK